MDQQRLCLVCSTPFEVPPTSNRRYCSAACEPQHKWPSTRKSPVTVACAYCAKEFQRWSWEVEQRKRKGWANYCSTKCRDAAKRGRKGTPKAQRVTVHCELCSKPFDVAPHQLNRRYCSLRCAGIVNGRKGGTPRHGPENRGTRTITKDGYMLVYVPHDERPPTHPNKSRYLEHRYVMAKLLGRWPDSHETIHHINGDKTDNRPENLQLRNGNHNSGRVLRCRCCGSSDIETVELT